jgi:Uma2 family endonuclease
MTDIADKLAPWADIVPDTGPMTTEELLALPDDGWQYELVEGRLVRMPPSGLDASTLALRLGGALIAYVEAHNLGRATGADGGYEIARTGGKATTLAPDAAFIRAERLPPHVSFDTSKAVPFAPDLAVEVASPNQYGRQMGAKARRYLRAGTRLVWIVWPRRRQVDVWRPGDQTPSQSLGLADSLDGLDVVPGFTYPLAKLFA